MKPATFKQGQARLRRLARLLRARHEADQKRPLHLRYEQGEFMHTCRTPACALGTYAAATPERFVVPRSFPYFPYLRKDRDWRGVAAGEIEFGLDEYEADDLFGGAGCNGAKTALEAAEYIEEFVKRREAAVD